MIALALRAWRLFNRHRPYLAYLALAAAAAALWAWGATGRADRDRLAAWGNQVCAAAGAELAPVGEQRGRRCAAAIAGLATFKADAIAASNAALAAATAEHDAKAVADATRRSRDIHAAAAAAQAMEKQDAQVGADGRVGPDWVRALNRVIGLR